MPFSVVPFSGDAISSVGAGLQLIYDSSVLIDAARPYGGIAYTLQNACFDTPQLFFGPEDSYEFNVSAEYTLSFNLSARKNTTDFKGKVEVYFVGTAFPSRNPLGVLLETYELDYGLLYHPFGLQQINFQPLASGNGYLRFVVYGAHWHVSDVSIKPASEFGYTPDVVEFVLPVVGHKLENLKFNCELYDINNNLVPVTVATDPTFFDGGNTVIKGDGHRIDGELLITPSGSVGATITTKGYTDKTGAFQPGSTAIFIGAGQHASTNTPFLVASSSNGPVFSLGDRLIAENSGSGAGKKFVVTVSGTLLVENTPNTFVDVRTLIGGISSSAQLYAIEAATNALISSSINLAFSSSVLSTVITSNSASQAQYAAAASASIAAQAISFSASLAQKEVADQLAMTASIISTSSSLALQAVSYSASIVASLVAYSASNAQYIVSTSVVDSVNKIKLPTSVKTQDGLYLESASMGFYNVAQAQYPVVINATGQFRFADTASYVGGSDPYNTVVGFANGAFLVRVPKLLLQTPNLQLIGNDTASASANVLKLGANAANLTFVSGAGFYADGTGNTRFGTDTSGSEFLQFGPSSGLTLKVKRLVLDAGGAYLSADTSSASLNHQLKIGVNAGGLTLTSGSGFYVDGAGNIRAGDPANNFIEFTPSNALRVVTQKLLMNAGGMYILAHPSSGSANVLTIGSSASSISLTANTGFYADGGGNFRVGDPTANFLEFTTTNALRINTQKLVLNAGGAYMLAHPSSGSANVLKLGTNASGITLTSGSGFYVAGDGTMRIGKGVGAGDYLLFDSSNALYVSASNFFLNAGASGSALQINQFNLVLGNTTSPGAWPFPQNSSTFKGFYANSAGQFFVGSAYGNYIQFGGQVIELKASQFVLNTPGYYFTSSLSGSFGMGSNPSAISLGSGTGVYFGGDGTFRAGNPSGQYIKWDGSNFTVNSQNFVLHTSTVNIDSTINSGTIALASAVGFNSGNGIWMDGTGNFRVGDPAGQRISYDSSLLTVSASAFDLRSSNAAISSVNGGVILLVGSSSVATHTFQGGVGAYDIFSGSFGSVYFSLNTQIGSAITVAKFMGGLETDYMMNSSFYTRDATGTSKQLVWTMGSGSANGSLSASLAANISTAGAVNANTASVSQVNVAATQIDITRRGYVAFQITGSSANETHLRPFHSSSRFVLPVGTNLYATR